MTTYTGKLLSIDRVEVTTPAYYRLRIQLDDPADAKAIQAAPNSTTVQSRDDNGQIVTFTGLVTIEDETAGIIVGNFNER